LVLELPRQEPSMFLGELDCLVHHACTTGGCRCDDDLGAEKAHQPSSLDAERFRHRHYEWVALRGADHGETDTCVAARCLDHCLSRLERTPSFRVLDDAECESILHGAEWIERLDLDVEIDARGCESVDLDR